MFSLGMTYKMLYSVLLNVFCLSYFRLWRKLDVDLHDQVSILAPVTRPLEFSKLFVLIRKKYFSTLLYFFKSLVFFVHFHLIIGLGKRKKCNFPWQWAKLFDPDPRLLTIDQRIHEAFAELMSMFVFDHQQKEQCQIAIKVNDKSPATRQISIEFSNFGQNES